MNKSNNKHPVLSKCKRSYQLFTPMILALVSILATSSLSLANPEENEKNAEKVEKDLPNDGKSGFYAMLSPQVGGGHMVWYRGGEMKYLSKNSMLDVRDIKISNISHHYVVKVFPHPSSREFLLEHSKSPQPYIFAIDYMEDGHILWSRSLTEILSEDWIIVGVFDTEKEAGKLAEQLRLEGKKKPVTKEKAPVNGKAEIDGDDQPATSPEVKPEGADKP